MTPAPFDAAHCAVRLRTTLMQLSRQLRSGMQQAGLNGAALSVLGQLYRGGSMTPTQLAGREGVKLQSLTRLLAELDLDGSLERRVNPADARQSLLSLTAKGKRDLLAAVRQGEASLARMIQTCLHKDEQAQLLHACTLLDRIAAAMRGAPDSLAPDSGA